MTLTFTEAFSIYRQKILVDHPGPQAKAFQAWQIVKPYLLAAEVSEVLEELEHVRLGHTTRASFYALLSEIEERIKL